MQAIVGKVLYLATALLAAVSLLAGSPQRAWAHGKEVRIGVSSLTPNPDRPLSRLYRIFVTYLDGDPVSGLKVELSAQRQEGGQEVGPVTATALGQPGLYALEVTYARFGRWDVSLRVSGPGGEEGETRFTEEVLPTIAANPRPEGAAAGAPAERRFQLLLSFGWLDVANVAVRVLHSAAALAWFGLTGLILAAYWAVPPGTRPSLLARLSPVFSPAAALSLGLLAATGIYNAVFNAPIKPPGVFALDAMLRLPFGAAYLVAFAFKLLALAVIVFLALRMNRALQTATAPAAVAGAAPSDAPRLRRAAERTSPLLRLALWNAAVGLLMLVNIPVTIYLHYLSHLGAFLP